MASGFRALQLNTASNDNTATGYFALYSTTGSNNTAIGKDAGKNITTGSKNTIIGSFNGNEGGLDIRTANNHIVLSDGDGNPRQVIDSSGNFGIGTTSPTPFKSGARVLEIKDDAGSNDSAELILTNNSSMTDDEYVGSLIFKNTDSSGTPNHFAGLRAKSNSTFGRMDLEFYAGRSRMEDGTPDMVIIPNNDNQANVGIGTTSPQSDLHIVDSSLTAGLRLQGSGSVNSMDVFHRSTEQGLYATGNTPITFSNNTLERMRISADGSVGIGTSSIDAKLHVESSSDTFLRVEKTGADNLNLIATGAGSRVRGSGDLIFDTGGGNERARIKGSNGYFGIGATSPSSLLHLSSSSGHAITSTYTGQETFKFEHGTSGFYVKQDNVFQVGLDHNHDTIFYDDSGTEYVRLDGSTSRVGIGTSSPSKRVHIKNSFNDDNNILLVEGSGTTTYGIYLKSSYAGQMGRVGALSQSDGGLDGASVAFEDFGRAIAFRTNEGSNNAERARFISDGAFLIGKTGLGVNTQGLQFNGGLLAVTKEFGEPLILNRKTTDGVVADFRKDNISVGSTRSFSGDLIIQTGITGLRFNDANDAIHPVIVNGSVSDGATDLGLTNARFKDLHLSGTVNSTKYDIINEGGGSLYQTDGYLRFANGSTETVRITSSGELLLNKTSASVGTDGVQLRPSSYSGFSATSTTALFVNRNTTDGDVVEIGKNGVKIGSISVTSSAVAYNTSSDARLKDVTGEARGLEVITKLNPVAYNWKADGKADEGLIAQEVKEIVPNAVSGSEDEHYQMDYSKLVTPLVKAVQELEQQVTKLKSEIAKLKGE